MELTNEEKERMLDELLDGLKTKRREDFPPNITASEYAMRDDINRRTAKDRLEKLVVAGQLAKEEDVKVGRNYCTIYFVP